MYCHNIALKMQLISLLEEKNGFFSQDSEFFVFLWILKLQNCDVIINITALCLFLLNSIYSIKMKDVVKFWEICFSMLCWFVPLSNCNSTWLVISVTSIHQLHQLGRQLVMRSYSKWYHTKLGVSVFEKVDFELKTWEVCFVIEGVFLYCFELLYSCLHTSVNLITPDPSLDLLIASEHIFSVLPLHCYFCLYRYYNRCDNRIEFATWFSKILS